MILRERLQIEQVRESERKTVRDTGGESMLSCAGLPLRPYEEALRSSVALSNGCREQMGFSNVIVADSVLSHTGRGRPMLAVMAKNGLERSAGLQVYVMCEIPSNVILAREFAKRFDSGFSIGSNDLARSSPRRCGSRLRGARKTVRRTTRMTP